MRFAKSLLLLFALCGIAAGCHAQLPVSSYAINYNATAPSACTSTSPCQIAYSDVVQTGSSCPATTGTNYAAACTSASGSTSCSHSNVTPNSTICAIAQTVQNGANSSAAGPISIAVPALPGQPTNPTGTVAPQQAAEVKPMVLDDRLQEEQVAEYRIGYGAKNAAAPAAALGTVVLE